MSPELEANPLRIQTPLKNVRQEKLLRVALVGNPNSGKSTIFNALTGLNQKVANYPGVTVDKRSGFTTIKGVDGKKIKTEIIDLPGTYSLYPKSLDERIPFKVLCDTGYMEQPDLVIVIADSTNLKRNLFLCSQINDLNIPVILALSMIDLVHDKGIKISFTKLENKLGIKVLPVNAREGEGISELKREMGKLSLKKSSGSFIEVEKYNQSVVEEVRRILHLTSNYAAWLCASNFEFLNFPKEDLRKDKIKELLERENFDANKAQSAESLERYKIITEIIKECQETGEQKPGLTSKIDRILTHKIYGYVVFLAVLFVIFQAIFYVASYPMDLIDGFFADLRSLTAEALPSGILNDLLVNGILAGLAGVVVFVPQIALLFLFIGLMEDSGYMARVSFMMDKLLRRFGLNGKSVIPLMSGVACAVPAIMATRTIPSWKERIITIMVTPLMSCSARLPVYALMIALVVPSTSVLGFINIQGITLMALYLVGFGAALAAAFLMKYFVKTREKGYYIMEMPVYRSPKWSNLIYTIIEKVKIFLFDAGKVIVAISIILWFLSSFGPPERMEKINRKYKIMEAGAKVSGALTRLRDAEKLENSYAGILGKSIEPVIAPLGFDWKIGIALITSFAAREVFVGTMSTIYSVQGDDEDIKTIKQKMNAEINPSTGGKLYTPAVGFSLMLFYAFAMQCMSTIAVVKRETASWKWPLIQIAYMSGLAYLASLLAYNFLS